MLDRGFAVLGELSVGDSAEHVAISLGTPIDPWPGGTVQRLIPRAESTPNTYSGIFGLTCFPFHTDLAHWPVPPRFLMLRCVKGYANIPTLLLDGMAVVANVGADAMARAVVTSRRPLAGKMRLLRLLERRAGETVLRWDEVFLKPASRIGSRLFDEVRDTVASMRPEHVALVDNGDTMVVDNWRMLHARPAVSEMHLDRHIERVYLESIA